MIDRRARRDARVADNLRSIRETATAPESRSGQARRAEVLATRRARDSQSTIQRHTRPAARDKRWWLSGPHEKPGRPKPAARSQRFRRPNSAETSAEFAAP